jgi:hypothetical protein
MLDHRIVQRNRSSPVNAATFAHSNPFSHRIGVDQRARSPRNNSDTSSAALKSP